VASAASRAAVASAASRVPAASAASRAGICSARLLYLVICVLSLGAVVAMPQPSKTPRMQQLTSHTAGKFSLQKWLLSIILSPFYVPSHLISYPS
jgi:hypothetical protein